MLFNCSYSIKKEHRLPISSRFQWCMFNKQNQVNANKFAFKERDVASSNVLPQLEVAMPQIASTNLEGTVGELANISTTIERSASLITDNAKLCTQNNIVDDELMPFTLDDDLTKINDDLKNYVGVIEEKMIDCQCSLNALKATVDRHRTFNPIW